MMNGSMVYIEVSSICNFNCVFCGKKHRKNLGNMGIEHFQKLIHWFNDRGVYRFGLTPIIGDFFCHPYAVKILDMCINEFQSSTFYLVCNGSGLYNSGVYSRIVDEGNIQIKVSLYGNDYDEFLKITGTNLTEKWYGGYLRFLKKYNIPCMLRTLKKTEDIIPMDVNIVEIKTSTLTGIMSSTKIL